MQNDYSPLSINSPYNISEIFVPILVLGQAPSVLFRTFNLILYDAFLKEISTSGRVNV